MFLFRVVGGWGNSHFTESKMIHKKSDIYRENQLCYLKPFPVVL